MENDFKGKRGKYSSRANAELIPKENAIRKEAIIGFLEYASMWEILKKQKKDIASEVLLSYYLNEQKDWFVRVFLNSKSPVK